MAMYIGNQPVRIIERSKNQLIPFPYENYNPNPWEKNGITWTVNIDGSVTANGTATSVSSLMLFGRKNYCKPNKTYTLKASPVDRNEVNIVAYINMTKNGDYYKEFYDTGKGTTFTFEEGCEVGLTLWIGAGVTVKNLKFYPMLNEGTTAEPFEPYNRYFRIRTGANIRNPANLIPFPYDIGTQEQNGVSLVVGDKGEITVNGVATANSFFYIKVFNLPKGIYTLSGNTYTSDDFFFYLYNHDDDKLYHQYMGGKTTFTLNGDKKVTLMLRANANITLDNVAIYPMLFEGETTKPYLIID